MDVDHLNVRASVNWYLSQGAPASKLVLGLPLYGRTFTLSDRSRTGINSPVSGGGLAGQHTKEPGFLGYNEVSFNSFIVLLVLILLVQSHCISKVIYKFIF